MKFKLIALALFAALNVNAQTKQISQNVIGGVETYSVLNDNNEIREGEYKLFSGGANPLPVNEGYYHNNLKDSLWKFYSRGVLAYEGNYKAGEKAGVWTGYTRGFERLKYYFKTQKIFIYVHPAIDKVQQV
jgi:antitoxin component YwqK of YwqJK toxin-antitoxin module